MRIQKIGVSSIFPQALIYTTPSIAKGHGTINHPLMVNLNDFQSIPLTKVFMSIVPLNYSFVTSKIIWNKRRNPMQLTQTKRKVTTVMSEEKGESTFALTPGKPSRLFLLVKITFPEPKAESALGSLPGKPSQLFLQTRFSNSSFVLSLEPFFEPCILIHIVPTTICNTC